MYVNLACAAALRWLREDIYIPDSQLYITLSDFEVIYFCSPVFAFMFYQTLLLLYHLWYDEEWMYSVSFLYHPIVIIKSRDDDLI